jgi:RNA polymerase sigma factor (sigma-70 family)
MSQLVRDIRQLVEPEKYNDLTDRELLDRFALYRDEAAFALLVRRHGMTVMGVCRRLLRDHHEAEDAFQAVFLVLARKAGSVRWHDSVAGWLFQVGYHLALRLRARAARRSMQPIPGDVIAEPETRHDRDLSDILDEELDRLPEVYRAVVILCCCEGKTRAEAALQLGCKPGTVKIRLERARALLRTRLTRRGVSMSDTLCCAALAGNLGSLPASLAGTTAAAACCFAEGKATAASEAAVLAEGVLKTMMLTRWKMAALATLALTVLGTMTGLVALAARPAVMLSEEKAIAPRPPAPATVPPAKKPDQLPRVLLFAGGPTRDYQFTRTFLVRESDQKRGELTIYLQTGATVGIVQDVPPDRMLKRFPTRFDQPKENDTDESRQENLFQYNLIVAFDPDWTKLTADQAKLLAKWARAEGHGLIVIAGPVNTVQLGRAKVAEELRPLLDLLPVELEDIRVTPPASEGSKALPLAFSAAAKVGFLKLDDTEKGPTAGWSRFFHDKPASEVKPGDALLRGFFSYYPVKKAKPGAIVVATIGDAPGHPYLVVGADGKGKVIYLGSGETWRLRQCDEAYHERFWTQLLRFAITEGPPRR